jgi:hypothetical protein
LFELLMGVLESHLDCVDAEEQMGRDALTLRDLDDDLCGSYWVARRTC